MAFIDIDEKNLKRALKLNRQTWDGYILSVKPDNSVKAMNLRLSIIDESKCKSVERTLCCKNVPLGAYGQAIEVLFDNVKEVRNLMDASGQSTGIAYIEFFTRQAMEAALAKDDGYTFQGRKLKLVACGKDPDSALFEHCASTIPDEIESKSKSNIKKNSSQKRKGEKLLTKTKTKKRKKMQI